MLKRPSMGKDNVCVDAISDQDDGDVALLTVIPLGRPMDFLVIFAMLIGIGAVVFIFGHLELKKRRAAWTQVAKTLDLVFDGDHIVGTFKGVDLSVRIDVRGSGKSRRSYTVFVLHLVGNLPVALSIVAEGFLGKVTKMLGSQDIQLGLPDLDSKLMVKGKSEEEIRRWARQDSVTASLKELTQLKNGAFQLDADELRFEWPSAISNAAALEALIRQLVSVSQGLSTQSLGDSGEPSDVSQEIEEEEDVLW